MAEEPSVEERLLKLEHSQLNAEFLQMLGSIFTKIGVIETEIKKLPCDERLDGCRRVMDVLRDTADARLLNTQSKSQSRSAIFYALLGIVISAALGLISGIVLVGLGKLTL